MSDFDAEWNRCKPYLEPACEDGWTIDAVEQEIRAHRATLWPLEKSAGVTQVQDRPDKRVLLIWLAGGDLDELLCYLPAMEAYARTQGCKAVECNGRPGWERVLPGFQKKTVVLTKGL